MEYVVINAILCRIVLHILDLPCALRYPPPKYERAVKIVPGDQSILHSNSYGGPETRDPETLTRFQVFGARGQKDSRDSEISAPPQQIPSNLSAKLSSRCHLSEVPLWGLRE